MQYLKYNMNFELNSIDSINFIFLNVKKYWYYLEQLIN